MIKKILEQEVEGEERRRRQAKKKKRKGEEDAGTVEAYW